METPEEFDRLLFDSAGKLYALSIVSGGEDSSADEFAPEEPEYPNACRYIVHSAPDPDGLRDAVLFSDIRLKEQVVRRLKNLHGIQDPWDLDPERFLRLWKAKMSAGKMLSNRELDALRSQALLDAKREAASRSGYVDPEK